MVDRLHIRFSLNRASKTLVSLLNEVGRYWRFGSSRLCGSSYYRLQAFALFIVQVNEPHTETDSHSVVPHFTFQVQKVIVRQLYTKPDNLARQHFTNSVETTTTFRKVCDLGGVITGGALKARVQANI